MEQIRQNNMDALGELYLRYGRLVSSAIVAAVPAFGKDEVEDVAHEVFIAVEQRSASYQEQGKLKAWLYSIATRIARRRSRSIGVFNRVRDALETARATGRSGRHPHPDTDAIARVDLARALEKLSPMQRRVLFLYEHQGMTGDEIADVLNIPLNTVWSHLKRARYRALAIMTDAPSDRWKRGKR